MHSKKTLFVFASLLIFGGSAVAGVEIREKSQMKFTGVMGKMLGLFGGKAAKEGIISTSVVVGNRKLTRTEDLGEIIDLDEEKVYQVNWKKKNYRVVTFEEKRRQLEEAARKMQEQSTRAEEQPADGAEKQYEIDFELKESGQSRNINGFDCSEVIMTITTREQGKTLEDAGGMVMTSSLWLTEAMAGADEVRDFDRRYAEALMGSAFASGEQMAAITAMYPGLKEAFSRLEAEKVNVDGSPVLTVMTVETVAPKGGGTEAQAEEQEESAPKSLGGLFGGLGKKLGKKKAKEDEAPAQPGRATLMTLNHEVISVAAGVGPEAVAIPAGFKEQR